MASNKIQSLSADALVSLASQMITAIGKGTTNPYGFSAAQVADITNGSSALVGANGAVAVAKAAYHAAVQDRETKETACANAAANLARTAYANSAVTPAMIAALGLQPRGGKGARVVPTTPIQFTATPMPNGDLLLAWNRYGNASSVNSIVEAQVGAGEWAFVQDTTASKITLSGYAPGTAVTFRVSASKNKGVSAPSATATVYPAQASTPRLKLAA